jgi:hypothetical protein
VDERQSARRGRGQPFSGGEIYSEDQTSGVIPLTPPFEKGRCEENGEYVGSATVPTYQAGAVACPTKDRQSFVEPHGQNPCLPAGRRGSQQTPIRGEHPVPEDQFTHG